MFKNISKQPRNCQIVWNATIDLHVMFAEQALQLYSTFFLLIFLPNPSQTKKYVVNEPQISEDNRGLAVSNWWGYLLLISNE